MSKELIDQGLQRGVSTVLVLANRRLAQPMTTEDALNLAEVLEGQVRNLREIASSQSPSLS